MTNFLTTLTIFTTLIPQTLTQQTTPATQFFETKPRAISLVWATDTPNPVQFLFKTSDNDL